MPDTMDAVGTALWWRGLAERFDAEESSAEWETTDNDND